jgi:hypothetical protein
MLAIVFLLILGTSIWAGFDSASIGRDKNAKGMNATSPFGWFLGCLLLWIIIFPVYLSKRSSLKAAASAASDASVSAPTAVSQTAQSPLPPTGWYTSSPVQAQQPAEESTGSGFTSKADELVKLDALRQSGVLSQAEFDVEKAKLLGPRLAPPLHPA